MSKVEKGGEVGAGQLECGGATEDGVILTGEADVIGGGGGDMISGGAGPSVPVDVELGANLGAEGGGEIKGEKEKGSDPSVGGDGGSSVGSGGDIAMEGASGSAGEGGGANFGGATEDASGAVGGSGGISISPIPLIPRRRLREILEHAQGECIMCSVFIMCI